MTRIYKLKINENVLRQIIFTDRNIIILILVFISTFILFGFEFSMDLKILLVTLINTLFLVFASIKIDRQPVHEILLRASKYLIRRKNVRY